MSAPSPAPTTAMPTKYANTRISAPASAADQRGDDHPGRVGGAHHRAGERRAEQEAVNRQDDPEQAVAGKARQRAAQHEQHGRRQFVGRVGASRRVLDLAPAFERLVHRHFVGVSRSLPTGTPIAMRVTLTPSGLSSRAR